MKMTFRWFGPGDRVTLDQIRQIPGVTGVVSALYDVAVGDAWTQSALERHGELIDKAGLAFAVVESIPVHEDIKLGRPSRDRLIDAYCESIRAMGAAGIPVLCYNFMPVFDWMRTDLARPMPDGSNGLAYDDRALASFDLTRGTGDLPGWATAYTADELNALIKAYRAVQPEQLWEHLAYFLERTVPVAEECRVRMALHPDDPPWPIFGLPRIICDGPALDRVCSLVDRAANGITFCTGSLGALPSNDLPAMVRRLGARGRIHFAHCRNVAIDGVHQFHEVPHPSRFGDVDMLSVLRALQETGFAGPMRPDHGRMIWGEQGRAGYGLYDRALGAMYLQGLWEGLGRATGNGEPDARA
ncbi:MAG TPA: mannonate dehydratase [Gemmatimonadaceae bacterium]|nr:mannonate dehydratase [Gemmatimonadaceae bacterium]